MSITLTDQPLVPPARAPAEERRGGELPDWDSTRPGEELPDLGNGPRVNERLDTGDCGADDRDTAPLLHWCGRPGCGGD